VGDSEPLKNLNNSMNYYVYIYTDPTKNDEPFYVGKGSGNRYLSHLSRKGNHPLTNRLSKIGVKPNITKIECSTEQNAFLLEVGLIYRIGRKDIKTGTLLNLTEGGEQPPKQEGKSNFFYGKVGPKCNNRKGTKQTQETKMKIANSMIKLIENGWKSSGMKGKKQSKETIAKRISIKSSSKSIRGKTWINCPITNKRVWVPKT
jgi:hypothetical protein